MVKLYPKSCILAELRIGRVLCGRDVNVPNKEYSDYYNPDIRVVVQEKILIF